MQLTKEKLYALALTMLGLTTATAVQAQTTATSGDSAARAASTIKAANLAAVKSGQTEITKMDVVSEGGTTRIVIVGNQPFTPEVRNYARPSATVITIDGHWNAGRRGLTAVRKNGIASIRAGQFSDSPRQVRIVANTVGVLPFRTQSSAGGTRWEILMDAPGVAKSATSTPLARTEAATPARSAKPTFTTTVVKVGEKVIVAEQKSSGREIAPAPTPTAASKPDASIALPSANPHPALLNGFKAVASQVSGSKEVSFRTASAATRRTDDTPEEGRRVSLDFVAADINDVLKALSLQSGINIVTSTDVKGNVTCSLRRVSFREALDTVVNLSGYKYARIGSTYAVGSADGVATLVRGSGVGAQVTETLPFIISDGGSLKEAIETAFPSVKGRVSLVTIGADGKTSTANAIASAPSAQATAPLGPTTGGARPPSQVTTDRAVIEKVIPKGGVISVTGTQVEVDAIRQFIESTERALLEAPTREAEAKARENMELSARATDLYLIRYASAIDLIAVLNRLVPAVSVQMGPAQGFQPATLGGSASFSQSTTGATGGGGAGGAGGAGAGAASTAGGASSSPAGAGAGANISPSQNPSGRPTNSLLLTGTPAAIARAREVLTQVDIKVPQIAFEARVVDTSMDTLRQLGFKYDFSRPVTVGEANTGPLDLGAGTAIQNRRESQFGAIFRSPYSVGASLDALETRGKARTLARPNLSALDGQPAVVFIGDQIKYVLSIQQTQQGQAIQTETATVGITLRVSGKASPDGNVTVYVHPEVSLITGYLNVGQGISLPQIATRFVDTTVRVKDGETFALAGLIRQVDQDNLRKVPFLGDLPFFGALLFQNKNKQRTNSEVVVLVTTRIMKD